MSARGKFGKRRFPSLGRGGVRIPPSAEPKKPPLTPWWPAGARCRCVGTTREGRRGGTGRCVPRRVSPPPRLHLAPGGSRLLRGPRERGGVQPLPRGPLRTPRFPRPRGWAVRERPCPGGPGLEAGLLRSPFPVYGFGCSRVSGGEKRLRGRRWSGSLRGGVEPAEGESCREPP